MVASIISPVIGFPSAMWASIPTILAALNPAGVGGIQDTHGAFFDQVNEGLLIVVLCRMVAWQSRDRQVSALCPLADRKADDFWRGLAES